MNNALNTICHETDWPINRTIEILLQKNENQSQLHVNMSTKIQIAVIEEEMIYQTLNFIEN